MTRRLDAFAPELKAYIVRRHLLEREPAAELAREYKIRPAELEAWVGHVLAQAHRAFEHPPAQRKAKGKRIRLTEWALVPGPVRIVEPLYSDNVHEPIAEYNAPAIARALLNTPALGGIWHTTHEAEPTWNSWEAEWRLPKGDFVMFRMTVIDDKDPPTFGGMYVSADCATRSFLRIWNGLQKKFPAIWLHGPDCRMYSPESFKALVEA